MPKTDFPQKSNAPDCIAVIGLSGAGRNTALNVLEDCGFHRIDNIPPKLLERLFSEPLDGRKLALGFGTLSAEDFAELKVVLAKIGASIKLEVVFIEASDDIIYRRFSETRRRHPFATSGAVRDGIRIERELLAPLEKLASAHFDTTFLSPHDLKGELKRVFKLTHEHSFSVQVRSFSYKHGLPRDGDMIFDCRFLRNPHWNETLRPKDGRDKEVAQYVAQDPNYTEYVEDILKFSKYALPAARKEGRSYFTICLGCSGGRHRSVAITELVGKVLASEGWETHVEHRELNRGEVIAQ